MGSTGGVDEGGFGNHFISVLQQAFDETVLDHFTELVRKELLILDKSVVHDTLRVAFVQSGYVEGGFVHTLEDCGTVDGNPMILERNPRPVVQQRVFGMG